MPPAPAASPRLPGLDGVRALAVIAVVWHHAHPGWHAVPMSRHGFLGVDAFFVLSGLLITTLLLHEQSSTGRISLPRFYARRALRIFPLYYALLAALALYYGLLSPATPQRQAFLAALPWHASYLSNWVPTDSLMAITWSLSTEEQFYLVWPPLLAWLGLRALPGLLAFLLLNQAVNFGALDGWLAAHGQAYASRDILQSTFTPILLGVLGAFALASPRLRPLLARALAPARLWWLALALLALLNWPGDLRGAPRLMLHLAITLMLVGLVLQPDHRLVRWLEWRPLAGLGLVSYGVYLLHKPGLDVARRVLQRAGADTPEALFVLGLAISIGLAALSYRCFEAPLLRLKQRFRAEVPGRRAAAPALP